LLIYWTDVHKSYFLGIRIGKTFSILQKKCPKKIELDSRKFVALFSIIKNRFSFMKKAILFYLAATILFSCGKNTDTPENLGIKIGGNIKCAAGQGLPGVSITLTKSDGTTETAQTDTDGEFLFQNQPKDLAYQISPTLAGNFYDGVDQTDADLMASFNNGTKNPTVWQFLACPLMDPATSTIGQFDLAIMKKLVNKEPTTGITVQKWSFYVPTATLLDSQPNGQINLLKLGKLSIDKIDANLIAVKFCDVNASFCQ
jgi:hypothetical protein